MPDTVKLPAVGNVPKKRVWIAVAIGGVGVAGYYLWYKPKKEMQGGATAYGYGAGGYGTAGYGQGDYYGYGFGNVTPYPSGEEYGYGAYGYGMYNPYTGQYYGGGGIPSTPAPVPTPLPKHSETNLQWLRRAVGALGGNKGKHRTALMKYLGGLPLNGEQVTSVREAIGIEGYPPKHGKNGYPPKWHTAQSRRRPHHKHIPQGNNPNQGRVPTGR